MTQALPPSLPTYAEALAAAVAGQAVAQAATGSLLSTTTAVAEGVRATAREAAAAYAKAIILGLWSAVDPWDGKSVQEFTEKAAPRMVAAQRATATSAAAGQATILGALGVKVSGVPSHPVDLRAPGADVLDGRLVLQRPDSIRVGYDTRPDVTIAAEDFTTEGIFNRPARTFRAESAAGATPAQAEAAAQQRLVTLIDDQTMLAQRFAEAEIITRATDLDTPGVKILGYRRIIHPELSRTGVCGLCIAAADRIYKVGTLLPIHDRCKCTSAPVTEDHDPADDVNQADLGKLYRLAGGTSGAQLKRVRYKVDEHGELGPVLVPTKKYKPRSAKKSAGSVPVVPGSESKADIARRQLPGLEQSLESLLARGFGEDSPQVTWHRKQIARLQADLGAGGDGTSTGRSAAEPDARPDTAGSEPPSKGPPPSPPAAASASDDDRERWNREAAAAWARYAPSDAAIAERREMFLSDAEYLQLRAFPHEERRAAYRQGIRDGMNRLLEHPDARAVIRTQHLGKILHSGRFKSQYETNTTGGVKDKGERAISEAAWFGKPSEDNPVTIYGTIEGVPGLAEGLQYNYGGAAVHLKQEALQRLTVTVGDSGGRKYDGVVPGDPRTPGYENEFFLIPEDVAEIDFGGSREQNADAVYEYLLRFPGMSDGSYIEAQIPGATVDDIEKVVFARGEAPKPALRRKLEALGIPWEVR